MKTEKQLALNVDAVTTKIADSNTRHLVKVAFHQYRDEMYKRLLEATQNLGHSAYGHSSSTTTGIDNLRNEYFDFLETPEAPVTK